MADRQTEARSAASKRCMWAFATRRRCKSKDTAAFDTRTTRGYYCPEHRPVVERLNLLAPDPDLYGDEPVFALYLYLNGSPVQADVFEDGSDFDTWPEKDEVYDPEA